MWGMLSGYGCGRLRLAVAAGNVAWKLAIFLCALVLFAGVVPVRGPATSTPLLTKTRHELGHVIITRLAELRADAIRSRFTCVTRQY